MQFLKNWLHIDRAGVALHPTRRMRIESSPDATFERCLRGLQHVLGGTIEQADRSHGRIEATFGLIFSERVSCEIRAAEGGSDVVIESRRGPRAEPGTRSQYVDALADYLTKTD